MTVDLALAWFVQTTVLLAAVAAAGRVPVCRASAAARNAAWSVTLVLSAGLLAGPLVANALAPVGGPAVMGAAAAPTFTPVVLPEHVVALAPSLAWGWAAGAALLLAIVGRDAMRVLRLKRRAVALPAQDRARLGGVWDEVANCRRTLVCWCDDLDAPAALGLGRPVIALPRSQATHLSDNQLQQVVLHELAHVRRRDDWWTLGELVITALTWVNPAVHLARRQTAITREIACDEWVVRRTAAPASYARCLADVAGLQSRARRLRLVASVTGRPGTLRRRIVSVLALDHRPPARATAVVAWVSPVAISVAVAAGVLHLPPMFVVAERAAGMLLAASEAGQAPSTSRAAAAVPSPAPASAPPAPTNGRVTAARGSVRPPTQDGERPAVRDIASEPPAAASVDGALVRPDESRPLAAMPLPVGAIAGMAAAADGTLALPPEAGASDGWWRGPVELGNRTGAAAVTASRAAASFFARVGSRVPQLLKP